MSENKKSKTLSKSELARQKAEEARAIAAEAEAEALRAIQEAEQAEAEEEAAQLALELENASDDDDEETWEDNPTIPGGQVISRSEYNEIKSLGLPPHMTMWDVIESPYNPDRRVIVFYNGSKPVTHIEISPDTTSQLIEVLNEEVVFAAEGEVDGWHIKTPDIHGATPLLHFTAGGGIVETIELTKPVLKELMPKLLRIYDPTKDEKKKGFMAWSGKHQITSTLLFLFVGGIVIYGIASTYFF